MKEQHSKILMVATAVISVMMAMPSTTSAKTSLASSAAAAIFYPASTPQGRATICQKY